LKVHEGIWWKVIYKIMARFIMELHQNTHMADIYKQVILVRQDLKMPKGKLAAQAAHASVEAVLRSDKAMVKNWHNEGQRKVVLKVNDLREMRKYLQFAKDAGLITALITDAGKTVFNRPTVTCLGIGPAEETDIDVVTADLKML
jgi:peptidyl-tRNA hydrolase, PTH2 family